MLRRAILLGYVAMVLSMGIAFAADANRLNIFGIAYVADFNMDMLPIFPLVNTKGSYFTSANLPAALTQGDEDWIGDTFYLNIVKPPSVANNGQNMFSITFDVMNPTNYIWTSGVATATIISGVYSTVGASLSSTTVNPDQKLTITFTFKTKIDITSVDNTKIDVSFVVGGAVRHVYINIIMRP